MNIRFSEQAWDEYLYWQQNDRAMIRRVNQLIREIRRAPFSGCLLYTSPSPRD